MYLVVKPIDTGFAFINLVAKILTGAIVYAILILVLDKDVKNAAFRIIAKPSGVIPRDTPSNK